MRICSLDPTAAKGGYAGPWNCRLAVSVGYANRAIDEPHVHTAITKVHLAAQGSSTVRVEGETVALRPGDMLVIEPGEAHTFLDSSADYLHLVLHVPGLSGEDARAERRPVPRERLGLAA